MTRKISPYDLLDEIKIIGKKMHDMQKDINFVYKEDNSPVSEADIMASERIIKFLSKYTPDIPVISEEEPESVNLENAKSDTRWIIDPLDGTRSYVAGYDGYGIHIALVEGVKPIMGVVYFPGTDELYFNEIDGKAFKINGKSEPFEISTSKKEINHNLKASIGWADNVKDILGHGYDPVYAVGGGRICITAEGRADVAWLNQKFSQWDVAAAHAIINSAGGHLVSIKTGIETTYDQDKLYVEPMIAGGKKALDRVFSKTIKKATLNTKKMK